jgi:hypothetical protein
MVILRDLSEVDKGNFSQVPYIGTPLKRQIRAHYTRADGSLNRSVKVTNTKNLNNENGI